MIKNGLKRLSERLSKIRRNEKAAKTLAEYIISICIFGIVFLILGLIFIPKKLIFSLGLIVGIAGAVAAAINIYDALDVGLMMNEKKASGYVIKKSIIRILLALALMTCAIIIDIYAFIGVTIGLVSMKPAGIIYMYLNRFLSDEDETEGALSYSETCENDEVKENDEGGVIGSFGNFDDDDDII